MKLSKRQISGVAVLAIALIALFVDHAFLGKGNGPAGASASLNAARAEPIPEAVDPPNSNSEPPTIRLAQRLETLWSERNLNMSQAREVFSLPAPWLADVRPATPVGRPPTGQDAVTVFKTNHQLRGVLMTDQARCVTVNDHILRLGEDLDGFKLVAIEEDSATFEADGKQVSLKLVFDR
jgi:hypothetical protein